MMGIAGETHFKTTNFEMFGRFMLFYDSSVILRIFSIGTGASYHISSLCISEDSSDEGY